VIGEDRSGRAERIPVGRIRPRGPGPRAEPSPEEVRSLAASIRKVGLIHPLLVRPSGRDFEVVCGQRRFLACRSIGLGEIPAVVRTLDDRQAFELSVAENARRDALTPEERREIVKRLAELFPGRALGEIEAWIGPSGGPAEPLPEWVDRIPETEPRGERMAAMVAPRHEPVPGPSSGDTRVIVAPPGLFAPGRGLLARVRFLLQKLTKGGVLDQELLRGIVEDLFRRLEKQPLHDFLDLATRVRTRRYVSRHCLNVAKLSMVLARALGLPREEIEAVAVCGLLHDVGMMKVKDEVFTKHAALDQEEWDQVKGHPIEGALLLTKEVMLRDVVARVALEHHERPDGSGYPEGKKQAETHLYARLINVVDTYGAMVSPRAHRLPLLPHMAMRIVMDDGAKGMLDWDLVQAFVRTLSIFPVGSWVRLEGGELARVVRSSPEIPEKPVIAVVADAQRNVLSVPVEIDLAMTEPMPRFEPIPAPV
jgi:putative nucleotidyltransferase with HDIG domain